jgi:hypothetical protein
MNNGNLLEPVAREDLARVWKSALRGISER